jgi:hypothetical protein
MAEQLATYLEDFLAQKQLAPREAWSFTLKLFSHLGDKDTPPLLLEIVDIRVGMSDQ